MDIQQEIQELKKKHNAVILSHVYQPGEVQVLGDFLGDSLGLCIEAAKTEADTIVFCGVHFMAESAKLLNPDKKVLLPVETAGCPMAEMANMHGLRVLKAKHPDAVVVCYVNSTARVKAESDICCTSSNAERIINSIPEDKKIIFVPDKHLGSFAAEKTGREIILWPGFCPTHQRILPEYILEKKQMYPGAPVLVHPECAAPTRETADFIGSTQQIYNYCMNSDDSTFIIGTEAGIIDYLQRSAPAKTFVHATELAVCKNMKKILPRDVRDSLLYSQFEITVPDDIFEAARKPVQRMLDLV